tara:strand:+ start:214 stop:1197 length:984 start_codon:yes stop_codon:yes gene_type:complete
MEFFNKKEEVLDFQLTEYGKYLLSLGRLKPVYYAFFDDDVVYDTNCAGFTENQNEAEPRIQSNTPNLKVIPTRTGAEQRVASFVQEITDLVGPNTDVADDLQVFSQVEPFAEKGRLNAHAIGRSSLDSRHDAAWDVQLHSTPEIASSTTYLNTGYTVAPGADGPVRFYATGSEGGVENIPQLNINIDYQMFYSDVDSVNFENPRETIFTIPGGDLYLTVENNYLLLEITEQNTPFDKDNFDIEVYASGSDGNYTQLAFTPTGSSMFAPERPIENDLNLPGNVEYYINILMDDDIAQSTYAEWNVPVDTADRPGLVRDIYESDNEEPC